MPASRSRVRQVCRSSWQVPCAQPGPGPGAGDDLIQALDRQRLAPAGAFQHHEQPVSRRASPVARCSCTRPRWRRSWARPAPAADGRPCPRPRTPATHPDEDPPGARPITSARRRPPSAIACTMARSRSVRSAAINAASSSGSKIRGRRRTARTSGWPRSSRRVLRVGRPLGTGFVSTPTSPRVIRYP